MIYSSPMFSTFSNVGRKFLKFQFYNLAVAKFTEGGQVVPIMLGGLANGVLVQYEDLKMCAYNMYLPAVHLNSNTGKI